MSTINDTTQRDTALEGQHVNPDGETDAKKGAKLGGVGGAVTGALAGAAGGPGGMIVGAVIGGVAGAVASGAAVAAVDTVDGDDVATRTVIDEPVLGNGVPGIQTGGHAVDGTPDTRGVMEKAADAVTGDNIDDKTGKPVGYREPLVGNGVPGIQTGGYANDGTPDTRGVMEKTADAVTGDNIDDKTGRPVGYSEPVLGNGVPGVQTGGHAVDGTPDTRGVMEKAADAVTGDNVDDKTGKRVS